MKNTTKNIKFVPTYACKLGKGKFVGALTEWQCTACGKIIRDYRRPDPTQEGKCPSTASGNHMWVEY